MVVKVWDSGGAGEVEEDAMMDHGTYILDMILVGLCRRVGSVASSAHYCHGMVDVFW